MIVKKRAVFQVKAWITALFMLPGGRQAIFWNYGYYTEMSVHDIFKTLSAFVPIYAIYIHIRQVVKMLQVAVCDDEVENGIFIISILIPQNDTAHDMKTGV